jgi:DNA-binding MarR family transcriptional regulator
MSSTAGDSGPIEAWELSLRTVTKLMQIYSRKMEAEVNIPLTWFDVLVQLVEATDGRSRMQNLAQMVILSPSGLTRLIDRIESAGLVRREPSTEDRREMYVVLTDAGRSLAHTAREAHHRHIEEYFSRHLTAEDIQALHAVMAKVKQGLATPAGGS